MATKIRIGGVKKGVTEEEIRDFFSPHASLENIEIPKRNKPGMPKNSAYVEIESSEEAMKSLTTLGGKELAGNKVTVAQVFRRSSLQGYM